MEKLILIAAAAALMPTLAHAQMPAGLKVRCVDGPPNMRETYIFERDAVTIDGRRYAARPARDGRGLIVNEGRIFAATPDYLRWGELGANLSRMELMSCRRI